MRESGIAKAIDLDAHMKRVYPCEWKEEIDYFLGNRLDKSLEIEGIVQES